jgi:hypothetical protein
MLSCCSDFNIGFRLFVLEPDPAIDYLDIARAVDGLEDLLPVGLPGCATRRLVNLTLDVPKVCDGVQSAGLYGMATRQFALKSGRVSPLRAATFALSRSPAG